MIIYLDVDGVCADIHLALANEIGMSYADLAAKIEKGRYDQPRIPEIYEGNLWEYMCPRFSAEFWASIPDLPWFDTFRNVMPSYGKVKFLSSVSAYPEAAKGRVLWFQRLFGMDFRDYILTAKKEDCASPDAILIDDFEENVEAFADRGGHAILLPQRWNNGDEGELVDHRPSIDWVVDRMCMAIEEIMIQHQGQYVPKRGAVWK